MITPEQKQQISDYLKDRPISKGIGTREQACSIAAINLALTGELTDNIPDCMSEVIGRWIIVIQDTMPFDMRNSNEWRILLPEAAGTGREKESARMGIILDWMWETVLPTLKPIADQQPALLSALFDAAGYAAVRAPDAAGYAAARAADATADAADAAGFWEIVNPPALLARLVAAS